MSKSLQTLICSLALALVLPLPGVAGDLRFTVMVEEFANRSSYQGGHELGHQWATIMTALLSESGHFIVVGQPGMRDAALEEQAVVASGVTAQGRHGPERGQLTPAQLLVKGVITHYQADDSGKKGGIGFGRFRIGGKKKTIQIDAVVQLVDSSTGMVVAAKTFSGIAKTKGLNVEAAESGVDGQYSTVSNEGAADAMRDAIGQAIEWMVGRLPSIPWRGSVVLVQNGRVYINRGDREGVSSGQTFIVGKSEILRDPDTGEVLDETVTELARIRADEVREKVAICSVVSGDASVIYKGMGVQPSS